jgi:hypothetical protein
MAAATKSKKDRTNKEQKPSRYIRKSDDPNWKETRGRKTTGDPSKNMQLYIKIRRIKKLGGETKARPKMVAFIDACTDAGVTPEMVSGLPAILDTLQGLYNSMASLLEAPMNKEDREKWREDPRFYHFRKAGELLQNYKTK